MIHLLPGRSRERLYCKFLLQKFFILSLILFISTYRPAAGAQASDVARFTFSLKDVSLVTVFDQIQKHSSYRILYNADLVKELGNVSVTVKEAPIEIVMNKCISGKPLKYSLSGNTIVISYPSHPERAKQDLTTSSKDTTLPVTGRVVSAGSGEPLIGASVKWKGTTQGTITNGQGNFSLPVSTGSHILTVSYIGFQTKDVEVDVRPGGPLTIDLTASSATLGEVVISTGYQEINKESYTGTAITVSGEDLKKVNPQSILQSLQVFDPSFKIVQNNLAGSDPNQLPNINVRGSTALPGGSNTGIISRNNLAGTVNMPTFILDGYEVNVQKIFDLDINRVKSVTLLKDAAATAVYGSRAANGVVVIVTKPPKEGKLQLSYNYELNVTTPDLTAYHVLNASQKLEYEKLAGLYISENNPALSQDQLDDIYYHKKELVLSGVNTDWLVQPLRTTFGQKHSVYLEGGSPAFRYGLSLRYQTSPGVMKGSKRNRYSTDLDLSYNIHDKLLFKNTISITKTNSQSSPYGNFADYVGMNPYYPKTDTAGHILQVVDSWTDRSRNGTINITPVLNPMYNATLGSFNKSEYLEIIDAFSTDWTIVRGLRLKGLISVNQTRATGDNFVSPFANAFYFYPTDALNKRGSYDYNNNTQTSVDGTLTLSFNRRINKNFINLVIGSNMRTYLSDLKAISAIGFTNDHFSDIGFANSYATGSTPYSDVQQERLIGAFTSLNYSYNDKYLLDFTFREDGASKFGANKRVAPFTALGLGWNIYKEDFMQGSIFSRLKIRASTGLTGSVSFSPYMARATYNYYLNNWYATGAGAIVNDYGNKNLQWQKTRDYDLGMEIGFLDDRLLIMPRYYYKLTHGLIADVTLPPSTGFSTYKDNIGDMRNAGWELNFQYNVIRAKNFNLNLTANLVSNKNTIVRISDALKAYNTRVDSAQKDPGNIGAPLLHYQEGQSLNTIYAVRSLGIDPEDGKEIYVKKDGTLTYDWNAQDIVPVGNAEPKVEGYFGASIRYKQFNLNFNFYTRLGGQQYNQTLVDRVENADPRYNVDSRVFDDKWKAPGDLTFYKNIADLGQTQVSSRFVQSDNELELQSLYLSYDAKKSFYSKFGMESLRFAFTMNDAWRWSSIRQERGIDYPYARSFTFSLMTNF
ncbi:MAG TPA: SusC/RagA family TonB-linked outer membrane protein [Chitinophagaceae bacterium]|nr:SusC/RagA family TonB-linked outer membrane protein [Chitinophagaceae bacterium]